MFGSRFSICFTLTTLIGFCATPSAVAQQGNYRGIEQTAFRREKGEQRASATFSRSSPAVGDRIEQTLSVEMRLATSLRRGQELLEKVTTTMRNEQHRALTTTDLADGRTTAVLVRYDRATTQVSKIAQNEAPPPIASHAAAPIAQPVEGNSYHCHREPGEAPRLVITDDKGNIPPMSEYEIVARNMETVGRPNPFADFLSGRSVRVGETIALPKEVAGRLFGMGEEFGDVLRFDLTLRSIETESGSPCAVFHAQVDAASNDSSQMRVQLEGPLVVEIDTCRARRIQLAGPIAMSETRGSYSTAHQFIATGKLAMTIASSYHDVNR